MKFIEWITSLVRKITPIELRINTIRLIKLVVKFLSSKSRIIEVASRKFYEKFLVHRIKVDLIHWRKYKKIFFHKESKMKILFVIGTLGLGGAEKQLLYLMEQLKKKEIDCVLAVINHDPKTTKKTLIKKYEELNYKIFYLNELPKSYDYEWSKNEIFVNASKIINVVESERISIVHSWMDYANACTLLANVHLSPDIKVILGLRSTSPSSYSDNIWNKIYQFLYMNLTSENCKFIANSIRGANSYADWMNFKQIEVIPNGIPKDYLKLSRPERRVSTRLKVIGVMRFSHEKGPDIWIRVAHEVLSRAKDIEFHLYGEGPLFEAISNKVKLIAVGEKLILHGLSFNCWREDNWDVLLSTSRTEGMPNVILEASMMGIPTVAFKVGGIEEILNENECVLVDFGDVKQAAQSIIELSLDRRYAKCLGDAAHNKVEEKYSLTKMVTSYEQIYKR